MMGAILSQAAAVKLPVCSVLGVLASIIVSHLRFALSYIDATAAKARLVGQLEGG
ncbi:hypothetical protein PO860_21615 [Rhizobium sp. BJ04]|uniref:hypothetical protein n=1 Tax=Rhizobium binxianense TaxID=3024242 RepID=UPI0023AA148F|nr:hypothetical protein [Rhizobium sp. BJ04]WEA62609.1 hypothetical protein PO860_21615 [Rhizobium sp. BJ04]